MDYLSIIKYPIEKELDDFSVMFGQAMAAPQAGMLELALKHIAQRGGKRPRF